MRSAMPLVLVLALLLASSALGLEWSIVGSWGKGEVEDVAFDNGLLAVVGSTKEYGAGGEDAFIAVYDCSNALRSYTVGRALGSKPQ